MAPKDLVQAIHSCPWLLCLSAKDQARPNLRILKAHGFSDQRPSAAAGGGGGGAGADAGAAAPAGESSQIGRLVSRSPLLLALPGKQLQPLLEVSGREGR